MAELTANSIRHAFGRRLRWRRYAYRLLTPMLRTTMLPAVLLFAAGILFPPARASAQAVTVTNSPFPVTAAYQNVQQNVTVTVNTPIVLQAPIQMASGSTEFSVANSSTCPLYTLLSPGTVCTVSINFYAQRAGYASAPAPIGRSAVLQVSYYDETLSQPINLNVPLTGSGSAPTIVLVPGQISDLVGNDASPQSGYGGDGGVASGAVFTTPAAIAEDVLGNIYIADTGNNIIRVVYN
jgi:hypothetical protein